MSPVYEFECEECGLVQDKYCKVEERNESVICPLCGNIQKRILSKMSVRVFNPQVVSATLTDKDGNDVNQYVRNKRELTDAVNKYNDSMRASTTGKIAVLE